MDFATFKTQIKLELGQPLDEQIVLAFEREHGVVLPEVYRQFLLEIGNGAPQYGLFNFGEIDDGFEFKQWKKHDWCIGILAEPFPYSEEWNDLSLSPDYELEDEDLLEKQIEVFEEFYFDNKHINGAIPICHHGCAIRDYLIVTGAERGNVWRDDRANSSGLSPVQTSNKNRVNFLEWFQNWVDDF
jgi:SMI1 / KNR4 family (SUKH-1)